MGRIVVIKDFARVVRENGTRVSDVKFNPGGGNIVTGEHFSSPGDDAFPLVTDYAVAIDTQRKGGAAIVGYVDPINTPKALEGDKRIYARDSNGDVIAEVWLKSDGSVVVNNDNGSLELKTDGTIDMNGVIIDVSGNMVIPGNLSVNGKDFITHAHIGSPTAPTGAISLTGVLI